MLLTSMIKYETQPSLRSLSTLKQHLDNNMLLPRVVPIALVQEMNLNEGIPTGFSGKRVLCVREARAAIITVNNVEISFMESISDRDCAWAIVKHKRNTFCIASFYSDINNPNINLKIDLVKQKSPRITAIGDTNAHSTLWGSTSVNPRGDRWEQFIVRNDLFVANDPSCPLPTFSNHLGESKIDVCLTNRDDIVSNWVNTNTYNGSDHAIILSTGQIRVPVVDKFVQNIAKTDWSKFADALSVPTEGEIKSTKELNDRASNLISAVQHAFNVACPPVKAYPGKPCKWWTPELTNLLRNKKLAARQAKRHAGTQRGIRAALAKRGLNKLFQKTLRKCKTESWKAFTTNLSGYRNISSLFRSLKHKPDNNIPLLTKPDGNSTSSIEENLKILRSTHFNNSSQTYTTNEGTENIRSVKMNEELHSFLTIDLLNKAIDSLPNGKATGPDGIKNEVIKRLPNRHRLELLRQIRASIAMGFLPEPWLDMSAIYIKKGGDRSRVNPKSYRPIGLSSTFLKLSERLVNWRLKDTILQKGIPRQHAFTLGLSTETAISELVNYIEKAKCHNMKAVVLSIDIEGAFDSVPFDIIKQSLIEHGAEQEIVDWLDFLSRNRVITTSQGNNKLSFRPLEGTTQGGLNGPDIWIICLWAIIFTQAAKASRLSKFADDLTSAVMGHDLRALRDVLQSCLDELNEWFRSRGLKISAAKSYCMVINKGRKESLPQNLTLDGRPIPYVDRIKYLGVTIDQGLTWRPHITERIRKAKNDLMTARKLVTNTWGLTPQRMAWLYQSIVRPSVDYACHAWFPPGECPVWLSNELDKLQRLALMSMTACMYTTPTRALERLVNIKPLTIHLKEKAASTVARIYESVDKANWDGIGHQR